MANSEAWNLGWATGSNAAAAQRAHKQALTDEERTKTVADLYSKGDSLSKLIPSITDVTEKQKAMDRLTDIETNIASIYHPDRNPGALQKDWHFLAGLITKSGRHKPTPIANVPTTTPGATFAPDAQSVTLTDTPDTAIGTVLKPGADLSANLRAVRAGTKLAPGTGTGTQSVTLPSAPVTIPGTATPQVKSLAAMSPVERQQYQRREQARKRAELDVAAAGLTPEQTAQADAAQKMAYVRQAVKDYNTINPQATSQQKAAFLADIVEKTYGTTAKPVWKEYVGPDGQKEWMDASKPESIPPGWNATGTESADTRTRADFAEYQRLHPDYKGTLQQWKVEQGQLGKLAVPTNRDDRYIAIQQKVAEKTPLTKDEQAYADGYDMYVKKRVTGPMLDRVQAQATDRIIPVIGQDPRDPGKVTLMPAGEAAKAKAGTPASIAFQTERAMQKYMTSGKGGENLQAFDTAVSHLTLLNDTVDAMNNGETQLANKLGNAAGVQLGDDAVTNFLTVKNAVAGEIAKVFTNRGATGEEIELLNQTINSSQSMEQLKGAIGYYIDLMGGKLDALNTQFESAQPGGGGVAGALDAARKAEEATRKKIAGGTAAGAGATGAGAAGGAAKGKSVAAAMKYWKDKGQPKTEAWVLEDMKKHGVTPVYP